MLRIPLSALIILPLLSACANAATSLTDGQTAAVHATCAQVMRLQPGEAQFEGCVQSLSQTVAREGEAERLAAAYGDCDRQADKRGTPGYARCVLDHAANEPVGHRVSALDASYAQPVAGDTDSYFHTDFAQRRRREEYACADLGQVPGSQGYTACVDDLQATLFDLDHPAD